MSTSLLPEPLAPVVAEKPKERKARIVWTQAQVVALVSGKGSTGHTVAEENAKLVALGLVEKPQKATLDADKLADTHTRLADLFEEYVPEQREMAVRHVIKELQSMLPKRPAK